MSEILSVIGLGSAAFAVTLAIVLFIALVLHWGHQKEQGLMPYIFYSTFLIFALTTLLSGRNLDQPNPFADLFMTKHPLLVWLGRANSLFILFAACERIAQRFLQSGYKPSTPTFLLAALWLYFFTNIVSSAFFGAHSSLSHEYLYSILAGTGALLLAQGEGDTAVRAVRNALFIFIFLSALTLALRPEMVIDRHYQGLIPGFNLRYCGLSSHANSFAPLIVVFLMCLWDKPFSSAWLTLLGWTVGLISLVLTQSKTSWIAFAVCALCIGYFHYGDFFRRQIYNARHPQFAMTLVLMMMATMATTGFIFIFTELGDTIYLFFTTSEGEKLLSLSGRDQIWDVAIQEWRRNPLFGYGLNIWDEYYRAEIGIPSAVHAHSQFHQSLSSAGIVGITGLIVYAVALFRFALQTAKPSKGLSIGLFIIILAGSLSEIPLAMNSLGPEVLTHLLLLMLIASHKASRPIAQSDARATGGGRNFAASNEVV
ncbi:MAG: O-antigen ligase family protein [Methylobacter sp.]